MMIKTTKIMAVIFITLMLLYCSPGKGDKLIDIKLKRNITIGGSEDDLTQVFKFIMNIAIDKQGGIYVMDTNLSLVRKFDKQGHFLWELNKKGQGPGEFMRIVDLDTDEDGKLYIADQNKRRIIIYSRDGAYLNEFITKDGSPLRLAVDSKGFVYVHFIDKTSGYMLHKFTSAGEPVLSFLEAGNKDEKDPLLKRAKNSLNFCIDHEDNIYVAFHYEYRIQKYSTVGKLITGWKRELPYKPQSPYIYNPQPGWFEVKGDLIIRDIAVDSNNNIYAMWGSRASEKGPIIDVFNPKGKHLGYFYSGIKPAEEWQFFDVDHQDILYIIEPLKDPKVYGFKMSDI
ncbi:MAG: NHL repeat-containing protein [Candidatus Aminicenantes bacterium]|nr:NHL repeat-containing protein [Candidatus Aminicenantes bacterium]